MFSSHPGAHPLPFTSPLSHLAGHQDLSLKGCSPQVEQSRTYSRRPWNTVTTWVQEEAAVDLTMAIEYGVSIPQITEAVRRNLINRVENLTGLRCTEVNIVVNDVQFPEERPQLGQQQEVEQQAQEQEQRA